MRARRITEEERQIIVSLANQGREPSEIKSILNLPQAPRTIAGVCLQAGVTEKVRQWIRNHVPPPEPQERNFNPELQELRAKVGGGGGPGKALLPWQGNQDVEGLALAVKSLEQDVARLDNRLENLLIGLLTVAGGG